MKINDFKLECFFGKYEFNAPYLLTQSDCESMTTKELLAMEPGSEEKFMSQWLGYTETWGDPELRELVAGLYDGITRDNVLIIHGAQEGIFAYMNVMLDPGDHMIAMFPNYQSAYEVVNSIPGSSYSKWELHDSGDSWSIDFDELESLIKPETKLITVTSPNNPTGFTFTDSEMNKLCDICKKHGIFLFSDEVYKGIELDGAKRMWMADKYENCVSLGVMSKAYGLAGLRVGWLVSHNTEILDKVVRFKHYMSICDSAPSEYLAKVALRHSDALLDRTRNLIQSNLKIAGDFFEKYKSVFEQKKAPAGPVAFNKFLGEEPITDFCQKAVDKNGVLLLPASIFDYDGQYFRMGYGRKNFPTSLKQFEIFLQQNGYL